MIPIKLNIGCGPNNPAGYIGVDKFIPPKVPVNFIEADSDQLGMFDDDSVDEIMSNHMIEHLHPWIFVLSLSEWYRVLKPGADLKLRTPNGRLYIRELLSWIDDPIHKNAKGLNWPVVNVVGHVDVGIGMVNRNFFSMESLRHMVIKAGFDIIECKIGKTRQNHGAEYRIDGDIYLTARKNK